MIEYLNILEKVIGHLAWPLTTCLIIFYLRKPIGLFLSSLISFVGQSNKMKLGKDGLEIEREIKNINTNLQISREEQNEINKFLLVQNKNLQISLENYEEKMLSLIKEYSEVNEPNRTNRVLIKNNIGISIALCQISNNISKDYFLDNITDAKIVGLGYSIKFNPESEDLNRILKVYPFAKSLHAKFRLIAAIGNLLESDKIDSKRYKLIHKIFDEYSIGADTFLIDKIEKTKLLISNI